MMIRAPRRRRRNPNQQRQHCHYSNKTVTTPSFPTFVIIGAQKTGTTSLLNTFAQHPRMVRPLLNETHFFDWHTPELLRKTRKWKFREDEKWCYIREAYYKHWPAHHHNPNKNQNQVFSFEKTPYYLSMYDAPIQLRKTCPWIPKVIILLRDPVERAYSAYKMFGTLVERYSFEEALRVELQIMHAENMTTAPLLPTAKNETVSTPRYDHPIDEHYWKHPSNAMNRERINGHLMMHSILRKGMYAPQIRRWFQEYPRDAILVLNYEDLKQNASAIYYRILDFAGIPHDDDDDDDIRGRPTSTVPNDRVASHRWRAMAPSTRAYLEAFYAPYNAQLEELLGDKWKGAWM
jgi:hypothetical protein